MKRSFLFIALLFICFISTNAQINRTVNGITLGTSKDSALIVLKEKGFEKQPNQDSSEEKYALLQSFAFGGITWDGIVVSFWGNKVSSITLLYVTFSFDGCQSSTSLLMENLKHKYKEYAYKPDIKSDDRTYIKLFLFFDDQEKTMLALSSEMYLKGASSLKLVYTDTELMEKNALKSIQEL